MKIKYTQTNSILSPVPLYFIIQWGTSKENSVGQLRPNLVFFKAYQIILSDLWGKMKNSSDIPILFLEISISILGTTLLPDSVT